MPFDITADPAQARARLEEDRLLVIREAEIVANARAEYNSIVLEFNAAQCFTPVDKGPGRMKEVRERGKRLHEEIDSARATKATSVTSAGRPKYSTPAKTLRAAEAVIAELPKLTGDALKRQQARANELVALGGLLTGSYPSGTPP